MTSLFDQMEEPQLDQSKDYLSELVGDGKKFKTPADLAKGKWYADAQIEIQNKRMDQLRTDYLQLKADYDARAKLEEMLDQLQQKSSQTTQRNEETHIVTESNAPAMKPEDIEAIVNKRITETKNSDKAQQNFDVVMDKLREQYANNWQNVLKEKTEELGLSAEEVDAMARRSPKLFFKTMDLDRPQQQQQFQTPPRSDTRFRPQGEAKKTWTYYQELFKKDPKLYYDPKMTQEMVESHAKLGSAFEDGDFRKYGDTVGL